MTLCRKWIAIAAVCLLLPACSLEANPQEGGATGSEAATDETGKTFYAIGQMMARQLQPLDLSDEELEMALKGLKDGVNGEDGGVDPASYQTQIQTLVQERMTRAAEKEQAAATEFLDAEAAKAGATKTEAGFVMFTLTEGTGAMPTATDRVTVHYEGTLRDGTVFDSSIERGTPATFGVGQVISCWSQALQMMKVGTKARLVCPPDLAYGERGAPPNIPPNAALIFEVELIEIAAPPAAAGSPAPPASSGTDG